MLDDLLAKAIGAVVGDRLDILALNRAIKVAVRRAEKRFAEEYHDQDSELVNYLLKRKLLAKSASVQKAVRELVTRPFRDQSAQLEKIEGSFSDVLPGEQNRGRVDAAVVAFLQCVVDEVLNIPQLQSLYTTYYQKEAANNTAELVRAVLDLRSDMQQNPSAKALPPAMAVTKERARPWHNLPPRTYSQFIGREEEIRKLRQLMLPYPRSRYFTVSLDGIGGVGKSTLAMELAYRYVQHHNELPADERFEAIVWASAKRTLLAATGIQTRPQTFNTLADLYREIATVLDQPNITQAELPQQRALVEQALANQRTLLIVDNLETVDDEELLTFLRELPDPTKVLVTTRHRIDIAYAIRLNELSPDDALELMNQELDRKEVDREALGEEIVHMAAVLKECGGNPLAIVWSVGLLSLDYSVKSVLQQLKSGHSDIAEFCFGRSLSHLRRRKSYKLLLSLALFEASVSRKMLGEVAGLGEDEIERDDSLAELLQLSLINKKEDRFYLLPLTHSFVRAELAAHPELEQKLREQWIKTLTELARPFLKVKSVEADRLVLRREGTHLVTLANYALEKSRPDILLDIIAPVLFYYDLEGQWADTLRLGEIGLDYARRLGRLDSIIQIQTRNMAWVYGQQGLQDEARQAIEESLAAARALNDVGWQSENLQRYAQILRRSKKFDEARAVCQEAANLLSQLSGFERVNHQADLEYELGKVERDTRNWEAARQHLMTARELYRSVDEHSPLDYEQGWGILNQLGFIAYHLGQYDEAAQLYHEALQMAQKLGGRGSVVNINVRLALLEEKRGNTAKAVELAEQSLEWSQRLNMADERRQAEGIIARLSPSLS